MNKLLLIIGVVMCMVSCTSQREIMDSWLNHGKHELVLSWGPPTKIVSDGNKGEIYIYSKHIYMQATQYYAGCNYYRYNMMYINFLGKIYSWRIENKNVPPTQIDLNIYKRY